MSSLATIIESWAVRQDRKWASWVRQSISLRAGQRSMYPRPKKTWHPPAWTLQFRKCWVQALACLALTGHWTRSGTSLNWWKRSGGWKTELNSWSSKEQSQAMPKRVLTWSGPSFKYKTRIWSISRWWSSHKTTSRTTATIAVLTNGPPTHPIPCPTQWGKPTKVTRIPLKSFSTRYPKRKTRKGRS